MDDDGLVGCGTVAEQNQHRGVAAADWDDAICASSSLNDLNSSSMLSASSKVSLSRKIFLSHSASML